MQKVRIDKWLWSVRLYKTRTLAADEIRSGKVKVNNELVKAAHQLQRGDTVQVRKGGFFLTFRVLDLIEKRVSAPIAQTCYEDLTPPEELNKYKAWFIGKSGGVIREKGLGRPTKKERRELDDYQDGFLDVPDDWFDVDETDEKK